MAYCDLSGQVSHGLLCSEWPSESWLTVFGAAKSGNGSLLSEWPIEFWLIVLILSLFVTLLSKY